MGKVRFVVIERAIKKKIYWSVRFINENQKSGLLSVNKLARQIDYDGKIPITKRRDAEKVCTLAIVKGIPEAKKESKNLLQYLYDYWDFNGPRITRVNKRRANSISESHAMNMTGLIKNHLSKHISKNMTLEKVTPQYVRGVSDKMLDKSGLSNATIYKAMQALTTPLREAHKMGHIKDDPARLLDGMDTSGKQRGILSPSEFRAVLNQMKTIAFEDKLPPHAYLAVKLSASSGMRLGEILGLRVDNIEQLNQNDSKIKIEQSFSVVSGMKIPKGKKMRDTFIPTSLAKELLMLANENPNGNSLIFWSLNSNGQMRPVSESYVRARFYDALLDVLDVENGFNPRKWDKIPKKHKHGADREGWVYDTVEVDGVQVRRAELVRRERNIVFHSFRHYYVTRATSVVTDESLLRLSVGHSSTAMTDTYAGHITEEKARPLIDVSHTILEETEAVK